MCRNQHRSVSLGSLTVGASALLGLLAACSGGSTSGAPPAPDFFESPAGTFNAGKGGDLTLDASDRTDDLVVYSIGGDDQIVTGSGNDLVFTGVGTNVVRSGMGDDTLVASGVGDSLFAGEGDDVIQLEIPFGMPAATLSPTCVDGGDGIDELHAVSDTDLNGVEVTALESVIGYQEIRVPVTLLAALGGPVEALAGVGTITANGPLLQLDGDVETELALGDVPISGFGHLALAETLSLTAASTAELLGTGVQRVSGLGAVAVAGLDLDDVNDDLLALFDAEMLVEPPSSDPPFPATDALRNGALYDRLMAVDAAPLQAESEFQQQILDWIRPYADAQGRVITRSTLPYVTLGVIRHFYIAGDTQWDGDGLMAEWLANPTPGYWHSCAYLTDVLVDVLRAFDIPSRAVQHFKYESATHATCEFYSEFKDDWVYVDALYGSVFLDALSVPASYAELANEICLYGVAPEAQDAWRYQPLRFYEPFESTPVPSTVEIVEELDKRDYAILVDFYLAVTAIRYDDELYRPSGEETIELPVTGDHRGRWLVLDTSKDLDVNLDRYGESFWSWVHTRYHLDSGGRYSYDVVELRDGRADLIPNAPSSDLEVTLEVGRGAVVRIFDMVSEEPSELFRFIP